MTQDQENIFKRFKSEVDGYLEDYYYHSDKGHEPAASLSYNKMKELLAEFNGMYPGFTQWWYQQKGR